MAEIPTPEDAYLSDEEMLTQFDNLSKIGMIEYVLPTEPLGERWVVGYAGRIANMDSDQAAHFLLGSNLTATFFAERLDLRMNQ